MESVLVPLPKLYDPLFPHDTTVPSSNNAEALSYPTAISLTFVNLFFPSGAKTCTASVWLVVFPVPSLPDVPTPQDHTVPSSFNAIVKFIPADTFASVNPTLFNTVTVIYSTKLLSKSVILTFVYPIFLALINPVLDTEAIDSSSTSYFIFELTFTSLS